MNIWQLPIEGFSDEGDKLVLKFLYIFRICWSVCLCIHTYRVHNYISYIAAMRFYFSQLWMASLITGVATMSSLVETAMSFRY